jgi:hypothetical protein
MLSENQMKKYRVLYKERFGVELSRAEVCEKLESLVREVELTYKPMTEKEFGQLQKRREEMGIIK